MKKFITLFLVFIMFFNAGVDVFAQKEVSVYIDGKKMEFDVAPVIMNGSTMVPVRKIFEELGAEVKWYEKTRRIVSKCDNFSVTLIIDYATMYAGEKTVTLNQAPVIIDSRTLVPLRAIAEAFMAEVSWDDTKRRVDIETRYPKHLDKTLSVTLGENYSRTYDEKKGADIPNEKYAVNITDDGMVLSWVYFENLYDVFAFKRKKDERKWTLIPSSYISSGELRDKKTSEVKIPFSELEDAYEVKMTVACSKMDGSGDMYGEEFSFYVTEKGGKYRLYQPESLVYQHNKSLVSEWRNPAAYLPQYINEEIKALSDEICRDAENDYDKVLKIYEWVCDNIYYDYPYFWKLTDTVDISSTNVLKSRKTVCDGYSNLINDLVRAQGIPCMKVTGLALGAGTTGDWTETSSKSEEDNHAWNRAYVDNRWINIDATWGSGSRYIDGEYLQSGIIDYQYFDCTDLELSDTHKYLYFS